MDFGLIWSLLRQEKDEASPFRVCESGFTECLHSLFCRDEGFFVFTSAPPDRLKPELQTAPSRSGLSPIPRFAINFREALKDQSMRKNRFTFHVSRFTFHALAALALCCTSKAGTLTEDFSTDPFQNGWKAFARVWESMPTPVSLTVRQT